MTVNSLSKLVTLYLLQLQRQLALLKAQYLVLFVQSYYKRSYIQFNTTYATYRDDDTTVLSVSRDVNDRLQSSADCLVQCTQHNTMAINTNKTNELILCFSKKMNDIPRLCINGAEIDSHHI